MLRASKVEIVPVLAVVCLVQTISACAHAKSLETRPQVEQTALAAEVELLRQELDERAHVVTQLESRLSLLEAEQRQLRYALAEREARPAVARETLRIGENASEREPRTARRSERPVLRLYEDKRGSAEPLAPVPQVSERLPIAPLPATLGAPEGAPLPPEPDAYLQAIDLIRRRDFAAALTSLDAFLAERPDDPRVIRALFWRGEVLFAQKRYVPALAAFQSALEREPRGEKAADALLKIGLCHLRLGAPDRARAAFEQLKTQFPQSHAARLAQAEEA